MKWNILALTIDRNDLELATSVLYDIGVESFEVVDESVSKEELGNMFADIVSDDLDMDSQTVIVKCYVSEHENVDGYMDQIIAGFETFNIKVVIDKGVSDEEDWANKWKDYFKPFKIDEHLIIKPIWESYQGDEKDVIIEIEPGMAFGSGTHETTSMCTKAIKKYLTTDSQLLDVGCGSGILSLVAAKLGAKQVLGIDIDIHAVKVAKDNVSYNGLDQTIEIVHGDLLDQVNDQYNMVVANILAEVIVILTPQISQVITPGGLFIASGIIREKKAMVLDVLNDNGFEVIEILEDGEWVAIVSRYQ